MSDEEEPVFLPSPSHQSDDDDDDEEEQPAESSNAPAIKWYAYYDDEGRIYYYNVETEETSWDEPTEGFHPPDTVAAEEAAAAAAADADNVQPDEPTGTPTQDDNPHPEAWVAYQDEEGAEYYYNTATGKTQWDRPEGFIEAPPDQQAPEPMDDEASPAAKEEEEEEEQAAADSDAMDVTETPEESNEKIKAEPKEEVQEEIDPEILALEKAKKALEEPDSILEPSCIPSVLKVAESHGGNFELPLTALVENYQGGTAVCGLLGHWLCRLKGSQKMSATTESTETPADEIRGQIQEVICSLSKAAFSREVGDKILDLKTAEERVFLVEMIESPRWRALLIDLFAEHNKSAVLKFCLAEISKRGHHREIASRIDQSEHFGVFHPMLKSELTSIGRMAVSAGSDMSVGINELVKELEKTCTSKSFTYLYSLEVIRALIANASSLPPTPRFQRAIRKWEALSQILEEALLVPSSSDPSAFQKKRLEVATKVRELQQREKRQRTGENYGAYEEALVNFVTQFANGVQVKDAILDPLLPFGVTEEEESQKVGRLLVEHPLAIRALLEYLYKPSKRTTTTRDKCAKLVAYGVVSAEEAAKKECSKELNGESSSDKVALTRAIKEGAELCANLESTASFLVAMPPKGSSATVLDGGQKLVRHAQEHAAVAQGVMMWAKEFTRTEDYGSSASFASLSESILSLVRVIAIHQPFTRKEAISIAVQFLGHSTTRDTDHQKLTAIKEQSLRLLVFLMLKGEVVDVLEVMKGLIGKKESSLDASLIRYFIGGVVDVVQPPVSFIFARLFVDLLRLPKCTQAVHSEYFAKKSRAQLNILLKSFQTITKSLKVTKDNDEVDARKKYQSYFDSLVLLYKAA